MALFEGIDFRGRNARLSSAIPVLAGSLVLAISAKISAPFYPVPMTLQTLAILGLGFVLGPWRAATAVLLYLVEGALGLPVFAGTSDKGIGLAYMMGPTGGYLLGYLLAVLITGSANTQDWAREPFGAAIAGLLAGALIYVLGLLWLGAVIGFDKPLLQYGLSPFVLGDVVKAVLAAMLFVAGPRALNAKAGR